MLLSVLLYIDLGTIDQRAYDLVRFLRREMVSLHENRTLYLSSSVNRVGEQVDLALEVTLANVCNHLLCVSTPAFSIVASVDNVLFFDN